jgi:GNAT superfamily N-acetyltransferase
VAQRDWPLVVRRARASDEQAVVAFASDTWDGWDYIPNAWPVWLAATDGVMLVAHRPDDERPVALTRIAMMSKTEAWLEGIRVDPQLRGQEIASDLQVAELQWAAAQGATVIRYATSARNEGSHRLGARHGIELLFGLRNYWWSPDPDDDLDDPSAFDPHVRAAATALRGRVLDALAADGVVATVADTDKLWQFVAGDPGFIAAQHLYEPRPWALGELTAERFARHVERGEVLTHGNRAVTILTRQQFAGEDSSLRLSLLVGEIDAIIELVERLRSVAGSTVRFRLPEDAPLAQDAHDRLSAAGYRSPDFKLHILGRPIDSSHPIPDVDPARVLLADEPQPILEALEF